LPEARCDADHPSDAGRHHGSSRRAIPERLAGGRADRCAGSGRIGRSVREGWRKSAEADGLTGCVVGPYRRDSGDFRIEGENGIIVGAAGGQVADTPDGYTHVMQFNRVDGLLTSVSLASHEIALPEIAALLGLPFADKSEINLRLSFGLMQVLRSLHEDNLNRRYGFRNAHDSLMSRAADKIPLLFDPTTYAGTNAFALMVA
jgi:hypothetical protein